MAGETENTKFACFQVDGSSEGRANAKFNLRAEASTKQKGEQSYYVLCIAQPEESEIQLLFLLCVFF